MPTPNIRVYAAERQLLIAEKLGSGKDGIVWVARRQSGPGKVALKAHRLAELYLREKAVYLLDVSPANIAFVD